MKHILWPTGNIRETLYNVRIVEKLKSYFDLKATYITDIRVSAEALANESIPHLTLGQLFRKAEASIPADEDELIALGNKTIQGLDLNMVVHADHYAKLALPPKKAQALAAKTILAYDWLFRNEQIDYVIRYGGNNLNFWVPSLIGEKYGVPSYVLIAAALFDRCGVQPSGIQEQWNWRRFGREWAKTQNERVDDQEKKHIDQFIKNYVSSHSRNPRSRLGDKVEKQAALKSWKLIKRRIREYWSQPPISLTKPDAYLQDPDLLKLEQVFSDHMRIAQKNWQKTRDAFQYDPIPSKFIYFPLNQPDDAPHRCWNPMNYFQEDIATVAAHSLPCGYELVIKEHPYSCGLPSHAELARLQKLGVKIVSPTEHSLDLIEKSAAVFSVGDTTGWEAIMLNRPSIVYSARPFYINYPETFVVFDPNQLHHAFRQAVQLPPLTPKQQEVRYSFLKATLDSGYPGSVWGYKGLMWSGKDESEENVAAIASMLNAEIEADSTVDGNPLNPIKNSGALLG